MNIKVSNVVTDRPLALLERSAVGGGWNCYAGTHVDLSVNVSYLRRARGDQEHVTLSLVPSAARALAAYLAASADDADAAAARRRPRDA